MTNNKEVPETIVSYNISRENKRKDNDDRNKRIGTAQQ